MSFVAILGAGDLGAALAARLAGRDRVGAVRLIDTEGSAAAGKALDIQQSGPIEGFGARVTGETDVRAAAGAAAVVLADSASESKDWQDEEGLALLRRLWPIAERERTTIVCAGAAQRALIERGVAELRIDPRRICGTAPSALEAAIRALVALEIDGSPDDVRLEVTGTPPRGVVVGWTAATIRGASVSDAVPAHRLGALAARVPGLWPPGPHALASAAARAIEAIVAGSRRRHTCFVALDETWGRGRVAAMPARLGPMGVEAILTPSLSAHERTTLATALERS
jgi:malate dehydrogenase